MYNPDSQVVAAVLQEAGDIEASLPESAFHTAQPRPVQPDTGLPVDALEVKELPGRVGVRFEGIAIPPVAPEVGIGDKQLIVGEVGMRDGSGGHIAAEHRAGNGSDHPGGIVKGVGGNFFARGFHQGSALKLPSAARKRLAGTLPGCGRAGLRDDTAAAHDFPFTEFKRFSIRRFIQLRAHVACTRLDRRGREIFARGDLAGLLPAAPVLRHENPARTGRVVPAKRHPVDGGCGAQVYLDPLIRTRSALPDADEGPAGRQVKALPVTVEIHLVRKQRRGAGYRQRQAIAGIGDRPAEGDDPLERMHDQFVDTRG